MIVNDITSLIKDNKGPESLENYAISLFFYQCSVTDP